MTRRFTRRDRVAALVTVGCTMAILGVVGFGSDPAASAQKSKAVEDAVGRSVSVKDDYHDRPRPTKELVDSLNRLNGDDQRIFVQKIVDVARNEQGYSRFVALRVLAVEINNHRLADERSAFETLVDLALRTTPSTLSEDVQRLSELTTQAFPLRWVVRIDGTDLPMPLWNIKLHLTASLDGTIVHDQDEGVAPIQFRYPTEKLKKPLYGPHEWEVKVTATSPGGTVYSRTDHYGFRLSSTPIRFDRPEAHTIE